MRPLVPVALALLMLPLPMVGAHHSQPVPSDEFTTVSTSPGTTWRGVAFAPDASHALLVGTYEDPGLNMSHQVIARWTPGEGIEEVRNRTGASLVDVEFLPDGRSVIVGVQDTLLLGRPGDYTNLWTESTFAEQNRDQGTQHRFYGLDATVHPDGELILFTGSALLGYEPGTQLSDEDVIHGGRDAFFRTTAWGPAGTFAWVETAIQREDQAFLGSIWRTDGAPPLGNEDNVGVYGRFNPGSSLLNTIAFAPNGSYAALAGRDGAQASILTWSSQRPSAHMHEGSDQPHNHRWQYQPTAKDDGPITCISWHPSGRYALTTGLEADVLGILGPNSWTPLLHRGPDLFDCAFHPSGSYALAVGEDGAVLRVEHEDGPLGTVVHPEAGTLVPPRTDQAFLVDVIDRGRAGNVTVTGWLGPNATVHTGTQNGTWYEIPVNTTDLEDGTHELTVEITTDAGTTRFTHPFLVNNQEFTPARPSMLEPTGLEGQGSDSDGRFTLNWEPLDAPVVYQVQEQRTERGSNATRTLQAGGASNLTVRVTDDGSYLYRVRAVNGFGQQGPWSQSVVVNVILDSDGDGVPDSRDPQPYEANNWGDSDGDGIPDDREYNQCSDPFDANSTPSTDDDGDGIPNGIECRQGTDPLDPNDPNPQDDGPDPNETNGDDDSDAGGGNGIPMPGIAAALSAAIAAALVARLRED